MFYLLFEILQQRNHTVGLFKNTSILYILTILFRTCVFRRVLIMRRRSQAIAMYPNIERRTLKRHVINAPGGNRVKTSVQFYGLQPRLYRQDNRITRGNNAGTDEIMTTYNFKRTPGLARVTDITDTHRVSFHMHWEIVQSIVNFSIIWRRWVSFFFNGNKSFKEIAENKHIPFLFIK